jgi:hypothetical protein
MLENGGSYLICGSSGVAHCHERNQDASIGLKSRVYGHRGNDLTLVKWLKADLQHRTYNNVKMFPSQASNTQHFGGKS